MCLACKSLTDWIGSLSSLSTRRWMRMQSHPDCVPCCWEFVTNSTANQERLQGANSLGLHNGPPLMRFSRATIRPILDRLGVDNLVGRMARLREDPRLAGAAPDAVVVPRPRSDGTDNYGRKPEEASSTDEGELWFDWAFVEFWKANYCELASLMHSAAPTDKLRPFSSPARNFACLLKRMQIPSNAASL